MGPRWQARCLQHPRRRPCHAWQAPTRQLAGQSAKQQPGQVRPPGGSQTFKQDGRQSAPSPGTGHAAALPPTQQGSGACLQGQGLLAGGAGTALPPAAGWPARAAQTPPPGHHCQCLPAGRAAGQQGWHRRGWRPPGRSAGPSCPAPGPGGPPRRRQPPRGTGAAPTPKAAPSSRGPSSQTHPAWCSRVKSAAPRSRKQPGAGTRPQSAEGLDAGARRRGQGAGLGSGPAGRQGRALDTVSRAGWLQLCDPHPAPPPETVHQCSRAHLCVYVYLHVPARRDDGSERAPGVTLQRPGLQCGHIEHIKRSNGQAGVQGRRHARGHSGAHTEVGRRQAAGPRAVGRKQAERVG